MIENSEKCGSAKIEILFTKDQSSCEVREVKLDIQRMRAREIKQYLAGSYTGNREIHFASNQETQLIRTGKQLRKTKPKQRENDIYDLISLAKSPGSGVKKILIRNTVNERK